MSERVLGVDPLTELPLLGPVVRLVHAALIDIGLPLWLVEFIEFVLLCVSLYAGLKVLCRSALPILGRHLTTLMGWVLDALRTLLLLPDLATTRALDHFGRRPAGIVYSYGDGVLAVTDGLRTAASGIFATLDRAKQIRRWQVILIIVAGFLLWNHIGCASPPGGACQSPITHWMTAIDHWVSNLF